MMVYDYFHTTKIIYFRFYQIFSSFNIVKTSFTSVFTYRKNSNVSYGTRDNHSLECNDLYARFINRD